MPTEPESLEALNDHLFSEYEGKLGTEAAAHCHEICRQYLEGIQKIRNGTKVVVRHQLVDGKPSRNSLPQSA